MTQTLSQIRNKFTEFFEKHDHSLVHSCSLIPHNDPSLMFVNSGMVQFKNIFTGNEKREYTKAVTAQKSVRAGGKHNDLENVGYTARHHTFFEMLGNFSFGDYFKEEAIKYAWDLLTKEFCLPIEKLCVTVYHSDLEAASLWKKIAGLKDNKIIQIKTLDNFWSMGDTGPCGPCSEIFYDHGESIFGGPPGSKDQDGDRFVEIWNLVFMEFEQIAAGKRISLPNKSIDTGMGLERISAVIQGVHNNYDIDLFKDIIEYAESLFNAPIVGDNKFSYRVIADHLRSIVFLIADGVMPSNEGRGYVLRRIMRRAMRHTSLLKKNEPVIYKLLPKLTELMGSAYPELRRAEEFVGNIIEQEEIKFYSMLDRGLKLLEEKTADIEEGGILKGDIAFKLYDTYGFPLDLTEDILKPKNIHVDIEEFNLNMEEQKQKARKNWVGSGANQEEKIWFDIKSEFGTTEFVGYAADDIEGKVLAIIKNNAKLDSVKNIGAEFIIIANQTPFYGESGGQSGDIGVITNDHAKIKVINTLKYQNSIHAHFCILEEGVINIGDNIRLIIDANYRNNLRAHHSATHILHAVLRDVLGKHVVQKGSLVAFDHLRFDFSHQTSLNKTQLEAVEDKINHIILSNYKINTNLMSTGDAINKGAMALFGERYDDEVRVVSIGVLNREGAAYSFELCGGTHASRTGDIGPFKIINESSVAAGIRRIEAVCGPFALKRAKENEELISLILNELKSSKQEIICKIHNLQTLNKTLEKDLSKLKVSLLGFSNDELNHNISDSKYKLAFKIVENFDIKIMRSSASNLVSMHNNLIVTYVSKTHGKLLVVTAISDDLKDKVDAGNMVNKISKFLGGTGGGSALIGQGNGNLLNKLPELKDWIIDLF